MFKYNRILIIGSPGSGKTVFSEKLHRIMGIPLIHLDDEYWMPKWTRPDKVTWDNILEKLLLQGQWIIEGNYLDSFQKRVEKCDLVILIDVPVYKCLWRVGIRGFKRNILGKKELLPKNVVSEMVLEKKINISIKFILLVLFYRIRTKSKMLKMVNMMNKDIIIF